MKKPILEFGQLMALGFKKEGKIQLDNGDYYEWWTFNKGDSQIGITYEFNKKNGFISGYVDFNCEKLKGRTITKKDIQLLIEIM